MGNKNSTKSAPDNASLAERRTYETKGDLQNFGKESDYWFYINRIKVSSVKSAENLHRWVARNLRGLETEIVGTYIDFDSRNDEAEGLVYFRDWESANEACAEINGKSLGGIIINTACVLKEENQKHGENNEHKEHQKNGGYRANQTDHDHHNLKQNTCDYTQERLCKVDRPDLKSESDKAKENEEINRVDIHRRKKPYDYQRVQRQQFHKSQEDYKDRSYQGYLIQRHQENDECNQWNDPQQRNQPNGCMLPEDEDMSRKEGISYVHVYHNSGGTDISQIDPPRQEHQRQVKENLDQKEEQEQRSNEKNEEVYHLLNQEHHHTQEHQIRQKFQFSQDQEHNHDLKLEMVQKVHQEYRLGKDNLENQGQQVDHECHQDNDYRWYERKREYPSQSLGQSNLKDQRKDGELKNQEKEFLAVREVSWEAMNTCVKVDRNDGGVNTLNDGIWCTHGITDPTNSQNACTSSEHHSGKARKHRRRIKSRRKNSSFSEEGEKCDVLKDNCEEVIPGVTSDNDVESQADSVVFSSQRSDTTKSTRSKSRGSRRKQEDFVVFLHNLPAEFKQDQLVSLFKGNFKGFRRAFMTNQKETGLAIFGDAQAAKDCAEKIKDLVICGRKVSVRAKITSPQVNKSQLDQSLVLKSGEIEASEKVANWLYQSEATIFNDGTTENSPAFCEDENAKERTLSNSTEEQLDAKSVETDQEAVTSGSCVSEQRDSVAAVVVSNLPHFVTEKKLYSRFYNKCQGVQSVTLITKGCGEVTFNSHENVKKCVNKMNGSSPFGQENGRIQVREKEKKCSKRRSDKPRTKQALGEHQQKNQDQLQQRKEKQQQSQQQIQEESQLQNQELPQLHNQKQLQLQNQEQPQQQIPRQSQLQLQQQREQELQREQEASAGLSRAHESSLLGDELDLYESNVDYDERDYIENIDEEINDLGEEYPSDQYVELETVVIRNIPKNITKNCFRQFLESANCQGLVDLTKTKNRRTAVLKFSTKAQAEDALNIFDGLTWKGETLNAMKKDFPQSASQHNQAEDKTKQRYMDQKKNLSLKFYNVPGSSSKTELKNFVLSQCQGVTISKLVKADRVYILKLSTEEDCKRVYESVSGKTYNGATIRVTWARQTGKERNEDKPYVVVGNLNPKFGEEAVRHFFNRCQGITNVEKKRNEPRARVYFESVESAEKAVEKMTGFEAGGRKLKVSLGLGALKEIQNRHLDNELETFTTKMQKQKEVLLSKNTCELEKVEKLIEDLRRIPKKNITLDEFERQTKETQSYKQKRKELQDQRKEFEKKFQELWDYLMLDVEERQSIGDKCGMKSVINKHSEAIDRELKKFDAGLPIYAKRCEITETVRENQVVVLVGETGSGKSTQLAQYLADESFCQDGTVVITQPRKIAAVSLARRVAQEYGCSVGKEVGYHVGLRRQVNRDTIIKFVTDRILLNEVLKSSESIKKYSCIIIDEAHERSIHTDLLLAMIKERLPEHPNLKLIVTSATLNTEVFRRYFDNCPIVQVRGRAFPVEQVYEKFLPSDYVEAVLEKAVEVCETGEQGDILLFLTQQNEIEQTCDKLKKRLGGKSNVILPLHGKLQPEDQEQVFKPTPNGKRKIVVATNSAETSITIDGIRIVIDSGMVKEPSFDPTRNMTTLDVKMVSRSSAVQRSGRAGRTGPGKCYCMYTTEDFDHMEQDTKPEILKMHLGMAVLQLLSLGVTDVEQFDFVEAPPRETLLTALASLKQMGAIDQDGTISDLGRQMLELPTEPRLSKALLEGLERGCGQEVVAMVALVSSGRDVFYRGDTAEKKDACAIQKQEFCKTSGDLLSSLDVYREWSKMPQKEQKKWCMENALNAKTLRSIRETMEEIQYTLERNHGAKLEVTSQNLEEDLRKSLLAGFSENVAWSRGHEKVGYTVVMASQDAKIHPASVLSSLGCQPQWILFQEMRRTTETFLVNVTPIEKEWLAEVAMHTLQFVDEEEINRSQAVRERIQPLGPALVKSVIGPRGSTLRQLESYILKPSGVTAITQSKVHCSIECDVEKGFIDIYCPANRMEYAKSNVVKIIDEKRRDLLRGGTEIVISKVGALKALVGNDMKTRFILQPCEFCKFDVFVEMQDETEEMDSSEILRVLTDAGDVVHHSLTTTALDSCNRKWGNVTYSSPEVAKQAKDLVEFCFDETELPYNVETIQLKPCRVEYLLSPSSTMITGTRVRATWYPFFSTGTAYIKCTNSNFARALCVCLRREKRFGELIGHEANLHKKTGDIVLRIGCDEDDRTVAEKIKACASCLPEANFVSKITVPSRHEGKPVEIETEKQNVLKRLEKFGKVHVLNAWVARCQMVNARMVFLKMEDAKQAIEELDGVIGELGARAVYLELEGTSEITCNKRLYNKIKKSVDDILEENDDVNLKVEDQGRRGMKMKITGKDAELVQTIGTQIAEVVTPETVAIDDASVARSLSSGYGRGKLKTIEKDSGAFVQSNMMGHSVQITGTFKAKKKASERVNKLIKELRDTSNGKISLKGANVPVGAIREMLRQYGKDLKGLVEEDDQCQVQLDIRRRTLLLNGSRNGVESVRTKVEKFLRDLRLSRHGTSYEENEVCPVCTDEVEQPYRLSVCGHCYCFLCIEGYITSKLDSAKADIFPQKCLCDGCEYPLTKDDFLAFLNKDQIERLYRISLDSFVLDNKNYKHCPSPDCSWFYKCTAKPEVFVCPECSGRVCRGCGDQAHEFYDTCEAFRATKDSSKADELYENWAAGADTRKCPQCYVMIEKNEGCSHVHCTRCDAHICWKCGKYFKTSDQCYDHQRDCKR